MVSYGNQEDKTSRIPGEKKGDIHPEYSDYSIWSRDTKHTRQKTLYQ